MRIPTDLSTCASRSRIRTSLVVGALSSALLGATVAAGGPVEILSEPVLPSTRIVGDQTLSHSARFQRLEIAPGATLRITDDAILEAETDLVVLGSILALQKASGQRDGVTLHLRAGSRIELRGSIELSDGAKGTAPGEPGSDGGTLVLDAPLTLGTHDLEAGAGGDGGDGAPGGAGGSIWLQRGRLLSLDPIRTLTAFAGDGGHGGTGHQHHPAGGVGGDGGNAWAGEGPDSLRGEEGYLHQTPNGWPGSNGLPCDDGGMGWSGYAAHAGNGGSGGTGWNSTIDGVSGGDGGRGGTGGFATAGEGGPGGRGGDCSADCSKAGNGGQGAYGSSATAGWGGTGGDAGDGLGVGADGGEGGNGGAGGIAVAGNAGPGGPGGNCCTRPDGEGGDGGPGGDADQSVAYPGGGGPGGRGGNAGSQDDQGGKGGRGGHGLRGYGANGGKGGDGGLGTVVAGAAGEGSDAIGRLVQPLGPFPGGRGGVPDGVNGADGDSCELNLGYVGADGKPGRLCSEPAAPAEENEQNHDETWENAYGWENDEVQPPYYGAFAERFEVNGRIDAIHLHLTQLDSTVTTQADLYLWSDDGGKPGDVLLHVPGRDPGAVATWPAVSAHRFPIGFEPDAEGGPFVVWAGVWGNWPGQPIDWFLAADRNGPGGGDPQTCIAPGQPFPEGWQPVGLAFPSTQAMGIGLEVTPMGGCCLPTPWGCCEIRSQSDCEAEDGTFLGAGVSCNDSPCAPVGASAYHTLENDCMALTVTEHGTVGFLDETQIAGDGWRLPADGPNHLRIGGLWLGFSPDSVLHRDFDADPTPRWEVSSCPAGQVQLETDLPHVKVTTSAIRVDPGPNVEGDANHRTVQRSRLMNTPDECGFAILEFTTQPPALPGESTDAYMGLFLDLDVNGVGEDDQGQVAIDHGLVYMTDPFGSYLGVRVLQFPDELPGEERLTLVPREPFFAEGYLPEAEKWAFLSAEDPLHVIWDGSALQDYALLAARHTPLLATDPPEWPATPQLAVALIAAGSLEELLDRADQAQAFYIEHETVGVEVEGEGTWNPGRLTAAPNPFSESTAVRSELSHAGPVRVAVFDVGGRLIRSLYSGQLPAGPRTFVWDGRDDRGEQVPAGIYLTRVTRDARVACDARDGEAQESSSLSRTLLRLPR